MMIAALCTNVETVNILPARGETQGEKGGTGGEGVTFYCGLIWFKFPDVV